MNATLPVPYLDTLRASASGLKYLPSGLASSTDVVDKFCKFTLQAANCNKEVTESFKSTTELYSTLGCISTITPIVTQDNSWRTASSLKKFSKAILFGAQLIELFKGLGKLDLIDTEKVTELVGRVAPFNYILNVSPPLAVAKDVLIFASTAFSIAENWRAGNELAKRNLANVASININAHLKKVHSNRIAMISDIFKITIVGMMLTMALTNVGLSTVVLTTSYGALKFGTLVNGVGLLSAASAGIKALHAASAA